MRWIPCASCDRGHATAIVFERVMICHDCRLKVIDYWMGVLGFNLAPHPFLDEFMGVETERKRRERLVSYEPRDYSGMYHDDESSMPVDNSLDFLDAL